MLKYLPNYTYTLDYEKDLNYSLMTKEHDGQLVDYVVDAWKSLEVVKNIQFLGYEFNTKESTIDVNKHVFRRTKGIPKKKQYKRKMINDDRCGLLTVHLEITTNEKDPKTGKSQIHVKNIHKDMLVPLVDENGNLHINGHKYYLIWQLVEKSTYTTLNSTVIKSLMPVHIIREPVIYEDVDGTGYMLPHFSTFVYRRKLPIMMFVAANFGLTEGLNYMKVDKVIKLVSSLDNRMDDCIYFKVSNRCYLEVIKSLFDKYPYVQGVVAGTLEILTNRTEIDIVDDRMQYIKKLTPSNNIEKGMDTLTSFNRMLDQTTKKVLKLNDYHKGDVYAIIRWAMMEFNVLRSKDNMSLENKRIRCFEYVSSLLTQDFSTRLNRIINLGSKATIDDITDVFKFPGNILIQKMHASGVLRFNDKINDMDFFQKFKWTSKGPHSLGRKNANNISARYRGLHPSYISRLDIITCGSSNGKLPLQPAMVV